MITRLQGLFLISNLQILQRCISSARMKIDTFRKKMNVMEEERERFMESDNDPEEIQEVEQCGDIPCVQKGSHRKLLLIAIVLANITINMNNNTVSIALPTYMQIFSVDVNLVQWVVVGYMLPLCMMMPVSAYLCERYSYRTVFLAGMAGLALCSVGCACSVTFWMLVAFRFMKGVAAGIVVPSTMAMLYRYLPRHAQAGSLGTVALAQSVGGAIGPTLAGLVLQVSTWRILFLINVPLAFISLVLLYGNVPKEAGNKEEKFDFLGISQIALGTGMILIAFTNGAAWGWTSAMFLGMITAGLILIVLFIMRQFHASHPLLNFAVLKYRAFTITLLIQCALAMTLGITALLAQLYLQTVREWTPAETGMFLLIPSLMMILGNTITVKLHKLGLAKWLISGGILAALLGNWGLSTLTLETGFIVLLVSFCLRYFGLGVANMPLTNYGLGAVPQNLSGHASSMFNWSKQLVQVVSTNILTVMLSVNLTKYYLAAGNTGVPVEGTYAYNLAATQAVNADFFFMVIAMAVCLVLTFFIKTEKQES